MKVLVTLPVYNEENDLPVSVKKLVRFLSDNIKDEWKILIVDNASTDRTPEEAKKLTEKYERVEVLRLKEKGRGLAIKTAWMNEDADIYTFMDIDLSTELKAFPKLVADVKSGWDVATGSRYARGAMTSRSIIRRIISRGYISLLWILTGHHFTDTQCGFKAVNKNVVKNVLPLVESTQWFFDTELLVVAKNMGYRIKEIPVNWVEDPDTRVKLYEIIPEFIYKTLKLRFHRSNEKKDDHWKGIQD